MSNPDTSDAVARTLLDNRLGLVYTESFSARKAAKIVACASSLGLAIVYLHLSASLTEFCVGTAALVLFIRLLLGAPTRIHLTSESLEQLEVWLTDSNEDSNTREESDE